MPRRRKRSTSRASSDGAGATAAATAPVRVGDSADPKWWPFERHGPTLTPWSGVKRAAAAVLLLLPRLVGMLVCFLTLLLVVEVVVHTAPRPKSKDGELEDDELLHGWRARVVRRTAYVLARVCLFCMGFYTIEAEGDAPPPLGITSIAGRSLVISNHVSYVDVLLAITACAPGFVAKGSVAHAPVVGPISRGLGCLFVTGRLAGAGTGGAAQSAGTSSKSRSRARSASGSGAASGKDDAAPATSGTVAAMVKRLAMPRDLPPLHVFPEGTTSNGHYLLKFRSGAFVPGVRVYPMVIRYPHARGEFNPSYESIRAGPHLLYLLSNWRNRASRQWLPAYDPSKAEQADPALFAANVCKVMSDAMGAPIVDATFHDKVAYLQAAQGRAPKLA